MCVKPEFVDGHVCYKLRNSHGEYGGIRVEVYQMILVGGSIRGQGGVVAKSAVVDSGWYVINLSEFKMCSYGGAFSSLHPLVG